MNNTTPDPAKPIGNVTIVKDFLPSPEELIPKKKTVKITMELTEETFEFLQRQTQLYKYLCTINCIF